MASTLEERWIGLGKMYDAEMQRASIERCNCMVRYGDGPQMPAVHVKLRDGRQRGQGEFTDPEGRPIVKPDSHEDMHHTQIAALLKSRNEVYIGHMFEPIGVG